MNHGARVCVCCAKQVRRSLWLFKGFAHRASALPPLPCFAPQGEGLQGLGALLSRLQSAEDFGASEAELSKDDGPALSEEQVGVPCVCVIEHACMHTRVHAAGCGSAARAIACVPTLLCVVQCAQCHARRGQPLRSPVGSSQRFVAAKHFSEAAKHPCG